MASWMLPFGILRAVTPLGQVAWRSRSTGSRSTSGCFVGPVVAGALGARYADVLPAALIVVMLSLAVTLLLQSRSPRPSPS